MVEIRFHGQRGQRAMASAELTALAAIAQGKYAQAFEPAPSDHTGRQVLACVRVSNRPIRAHKKLLTPDVVVVLCGQADHGYRNASPASRRTRPNES